MEQKIDKIFYQMSVFNDQMDKVDVDDEMQIVDYCEQVVSYLQRNGLSILCVSIVASLLSVMAARMHN